MFTKTGKIILWFLWVLAVAVVAWILSFVLVGDVLAQTATPEPGNTPTPGETPWLIGEPVNPNLGYCDPAIDEDHTEDY